MFWRRSTDPKLVQECTAFLSGRYLSHCERPPGRVPPWAWVSTLAHGERSDIEAFASGTDGNACEIRAASYLAHALLAAIDAHGLDLRSLQRNVLVPIELECEVADSTSATRKICATVLRELRKASAVADQQADTRRRPGPSQT
jgi:hypothetical protein